MQEPDIPPLLQTISKADSPLSFLETRYPPGPIRVILRTTQRQDVMISGGLSILNVVFPNSCWRRPVQDFYGGKVGGGGCPLLRATQASNCCALANWILT